MSRQPINESIRRLLEDNPNIFHVADKTTLEHRTVSNHLNREFQQDESGKVLLTDITMSSSSWWMSIFTIPTTAGTIRI